MSNPTTVNFIILTVKELKRKYGGTFCIYLDQPDEVLNKKVMSISNRLSRESSR